MDLLIKAQAFHAAVSKFAQSEPLSEFSYDMMEFSPPPGVSVDVAAVQAAGKELYNAFNVSHDPKGTLAALNKLKSLLQGPGTGDLTQRLENAMQNANKAFPQPVAKKPAAEKSISQNYYAYLSSLNDLVKGVSANNGIPAPIEMDKMRAQYESMKPKLEDIREYLKFLDATARTNFVSGDPQLAGQRMKEVADYEKILNQSTQKLDKAFEFHAGFESDVAPPSPKSPIGIV